MVSPTKKGESRAAIADGSVAVAVDQDINGDLISPSTNLSFENVTYEVRRRRAGVKRILDNISGFARPGEMLAMMGSSGAGKSTLLDILAGRIKRDGKSCTGTVSVNGQSSGYKIKNIASYVLQEDALHPSLTVFETIKFSARLRCPQMSAAEINARVNEIVDSFGLSHVRNTIVGNAVMRGLSGGERRRVSIAVEAVSHPNILFLDEPTSGLDSAAAYNICRTLKKLAQTQNKTIVATIHQPSSETFELFDSLLVLVRGRTAYFGPRASAPTYFAEVGFPVPELSNPADHYLYITNVDFFDDKEAGQQRIEQITSSFEDSGLKSAMTNEIDEMRSADCKDGACNTAAPRNGLLKETAILTHRTFLDASRNIGIYWIRLAMYIMMAVMFGLFWWQISWDEYDVASRLNVHFMCVAFLAFMAVAACPAFIEDRAVYLRERMNGAITVMPYVIANTLVSVPFIFLIALVFSSIAYPMCNFHPGADHFFVYVTMLFAALMVAESMTVAVSAIIPHFIAALTICSAMNGFMMVAGGVLVSASVMPSWLQWTQYLSYQKYSYESIVFNDFNGQNFYCSMGADGCKCIYGPDIGDCQSSGEAVLDYFGWGNVLIWEWLLILLGMYFFYRGVFYASLLMSGTTR